MTNEELLKPRYKVIADWPGNRIPIGSICTISTHNCGSFNGLIYHVSMLDKHPHLFKKLEWWEEREGPLYAKYEDVIYCVEFPEWSSSNDFGYYKSEVNHGWGGGVLYLPLCEQATEEEYLKNQL